MEKSCPYDRRNGNSMRLLVQHDWKLDFPWQMVDMKDWFYMVNSGYILPVLYLHVRILGVRSVWEIIWSEV